MIESEGRGGAMYDTKSLPRAEYNNHVYNSDPTISSTPSAANIEDLTRVSSASAVGYYDQMSAENSPCNMSPWNQSSSPLNSPWSKTSAFEDHMKLPQNGLIGSLVREEGHIYSLATLGDVLYTGSDSKNIRVWKNMQEYSAFKSASGLVKAIVIAGEKIFTGHQDGKIRVWKISPKNPSVHKRAGTLPKLKDIIKTSLNPSNYIDVGRHRTLWIKHFDAISCLSLNVDQGLLYSGSWDKTLKVWRISDSKCMESINAHDDAVNSVVAGFDGMVFTGSADGTVKVWRKETQPKGVKHAFVQTLLKQECAVTALALNPSASTLYCGSSDGVVNFWEREKQLSHGGVLKGHKLAVLCLATGGNLVFSGSADKSICVWRRDNGVHTCLSILTGHTGPVKCLSVERDQESSGRDQRWIVYSGSLDKSVKVWKVAEQPPDVIQMQQHQHSIEGLSPPDSSFSSTNSNSVSSSNRARNY